MTRKGFSVSPERAAAVEVNVGSVLAVIKKMAAGDQWVHTEPPELLPLCAETYVEHVGLGPGAGSINERHFEAICGLNARIKALSRLMTSGQIMPGDASAEAMAEATSAARVTRDEDGFRFKPREFFTLLDRAEAELHK